MHKILLWIDKSNPYSDLEIVRKNNPVFYYNDSGERDIIWINSLFMFTDWIDKNGLPEFISFGYNLGYDNPTGFDIAVWLSNYCFENNLSLPQYAVHGDDSKNKLKIIELLNQHNRGF